MLEQESFWDAGSFAVVTDRTKPAIKMTIDELASRGKEVYVVDMSETPDKGTLHSISELPSGIENAVVGITKTNPANVMEELEEKGIRKYWIHWRTETPEVKERCIKSRVQCITGRCPMMYLSHGFGIHAVHRGISKLCGKY
jgi:hypothetical protein